MFEEEKECTLEEALALIKENKIQKLTLKKGSIGSKGIIDICQALKFNTSISHIQFGAGNVKNCDANAIAKMLEKNKTITWLSLAFIPGVVSLALVGGLMFFTAVMNRGYPDGNERDMENNTWWF